jgi:hypothetical protein
MIKRIKRGMAAAFILLAVLSGTTLYASAQGGRVRRVQFPRGRATLVLKGVLRGKSDMTYLLRARAGQTLMANLLVEHDCCASLLIKGPDNTNQTNPDGTDAGTSFSIQLTQTGDYRIVVFPPDTAARKDIARYTLEVSVR